MPFTEIPHLKLCRIKHLVKICIYMVAAYRAYVDELYHSCGRLIADYEIRLVAVLFKITKPFFKLLIGRKLLYPALLIVRLKIAVVFLALDRRRKRTRSFRQSYNIALS